MRRRGRGETGGRASHGADHRTGRRRQTADRQQERTPAAPSAVRRPPSLTLRLLLDFLAAGFSGATFVRLPPWIFRQVSGSRRRKPWPLQAFEPWQPEWRQPSAPQSPVPLHLLTPQHGFCRRRRERVSGPGPGGPPAATALRRARPRAGTSDPRVHENSSLRIVESPGPSGAPLDARRLRARRARGRTRRGGGARPRPRRRPSAPAGPRSVASPHGAASTRAASASDDPLDAHAPVAADRRGRSRGRPSRAIEIASSSSSSRQAQSSSSGQAERTSATPGSKAEPQGERAPRACGARSSSQRDGALRPRATNDLARSSRSSRARSGRNGSSTVSPVELEEARQPVADAGEVERARREDAEVALDERLEALRRRGSGGSRRTRGPRPPTIRAM